MKEINLPRIYSQWDSRWANKILGYNPPNSNYNIYNYGCLISCIAMVLEYTGHSASPETVNQTLKDGEGFLDGTGIYVWGSAPTIYNAIKGERLVSTPTALTDNQISEIRQALDVGNPVVLQIDYNPKTVAMEMHYVLCIGYDPSDENNFLIADPLGGIERSLKDYLCRYRPSARNTIYQYIIYDVDAPTNLSLHDVEIDWDDEEGNRHTVGWYEYEWFTEKTNNIKEEKKHAIELNDRDIKIVTLSYEAVEAGKKIATLENNAKSLSQQISDQKSQIKRLESQNVSLYTTADLIAILISKILNK